MLRHSAGHEELTEKIIGCGVAVHRVFGAGLFESVYEACVVFELTQAGLDVDLRRRVPLTYKGHLLHSSFVADIIVENTVLVEVKAVEALAPVHQAQLITYLKLTGCPIGLLMNFNTPVLKNGIRRVVHPDLYVKQHVPNPD
jgi:GxxExxY protein